MGIGLTVIGIAVLFLARRFLLPAKEEQVGTDTDDRWSDSAGAAAKAEKEVDSGGHSRPIDHAAVFGAALAAVITLTVGQGPWSPIGTVIGVLLLAVIQGFYNVPAGAGWRESIAVGAVVAACVSVALAWPLQVGLTHSVPFRDGAVGRCEQLGRAAEKTDSAQTGAGADATGNCMGDLTTNRLWIVALPATGAAVVLIRWRGRNKARGRGGSPAVPAGRTTAAPAPEAAEPARGEVAPPPGRPPVGQPSVAASNREDGE
jgi:hypothetical protein